MSFFEELKRRNVVRVGIAYVVASWLLIQVADIIFPALGLDDSAITLVLALSGSSIVTRCGAALNMKASSTRSVCHVTPPSIE